MSLKQSIARFFLHTVWGFKVKTACDLEAIPKKVYVVYPHTSNWDFLVGILVSRAMPITVNYVGKESLFRWPFGYLFKWLGGIPVNRSKKTNFVDQMIKLYDTYPVLAFAIAPEGTRKKVNKFKSGFYHIAHGAKIPIILVKFDFGNKVVDYSEPFYTSGDYKADLVKIIDHFRGTLGHTPENACQWEDEDL
jgi:1-acyl-sn-glycerol-3-phosphate acyltransferase